MTIKRYINKILNKGPAKIFIISYPKAGRTWLRALLGYYLCSVNNLPEKKIFEKEYVFSSSGLPKVKITHDGASLRENKSYAQLDSDKSMYKGKKVLLLGRNVKDLLVSSYFQATKRIFVFEGQISEFIRLERYGAMKILTFYKRWYKNRHLPDEFMFIRYEEIHKCPAVVLEKVLKFLGVYNIDREKIEYSVKQSRFDNLKRLEAENVFDHKIISPRDINDNDSFKVRKGKVGNYTEYLSKKDIEYIDGLIAQFGCRFTEDGASI